MSRGETVFASLKELSGDLANIELEYYVTREADGGAGETDGGETEVYGVTENFTLKWSSQRIYMMDYERTMNQLFSGSRELFSGKRILLGISDGEGMYAKKSENGRYTVFVTNRELWAYDREEGDSICIFAFGGWNTDDLRALQDRHGVETVSYTHLEGSGRDHIWARGMDLHIGKVGRSFLYQTHAHLKGEEGTVLLHHKNVEQAAPGGGIGDQSQMAFCKGIAVHDDAAHASGQGVSMVFRGFREEYRVKTLQPVFPVFQHQHRLGLSQGKMCIRDRISHPR